MAYRDMATDKAYVGTILDPVILVLTEQINGMMVSIVRKVAKDDVEYPDALQWYMFVNGYYDDGESA